MQQAKKKHFRFEAMWLRSKECEDIVRAHWKDPFRGHKFTDLQDIQRVIIMHFESLFQSSNPNHQGIFETLRTVAPTVSQEMNEILLQPFTPDEVKRAIKSIANRLKPMMPTIISESQSAFIPGRLIIDNVLIAYEINHFLAHKYWGKEGHIALKLDISKAYDRVEWFFLERALGRLGFQGDFVSLIMTCVSTVSFSFMLNGSNFGHIRPKRGIRQGDPLSPYLFLFCAEVFSRMIQYEESRGTLKGVAVRRNGPRISHLFLHDADDTLLFVQAIEEALLCIRGVLEQFEAASGLAINWQKSAAVFSKNIDRNAQFALGQVLGVSVVDRHEKYLGISTVIGRSKRALFDHIKSRIWDKMQHWRTKLLSQA
ncbi:UNVERIFIED_CONTAM: putative mitochondrial protein [Sesamum latifolium]|uniref:Mitochondrial protein n=1 Tax=Sesamum latifolium TaxID=2727402 RepID=A0AAW2WC78_9LAMI